MRDGKKFEGGAEPRLVTLTEEERREMLQLERRGELPTEIDRSTDLFFRFLLGSPTRVPLLLDLVNAIFTTLGHPRVTHLELAETELAPEGWRRKHARLDQGMVFPLGSSVFWMPARQTAAQLPPFGISDRHSIQGLTALESWPSA